MHAPRDCVQANAPGSARVQRSPGLQRRLDNAAGSWINFSLSSASLSPNTFAALDRAIQNHDTISAFSLRPVYVGFGANQPYLIVPQTDSDMSVDLERQYRHLQMTLQAYFFRRDILGELRFDEEIHDDALHLFLLRALLRSRIRILI